ncbi:MAG: diapolycopene oxygenase [Planctomycetes bacterium SM23_32]|nr:MAG: diapolycopene oxygenase [Planctomycetes bacterium SM23_32]
MSQSGERSVVVVGAGLGGISAALSLVAAGYRVDVFEKNDHVGGKLNVLEKEGFSFDLGPSILTLPQYFERLFEGHGRRMADYVELRALSPHWRNFFEDGTRIDLFADPAETVRRNACLAHADRSDLERFAAYSRRLYDASAPPYFERGVDTAWGMAKSSGFVFAPRDFDLFHCMHAGVCRHVRNGYLRHILSFFAKYVGSSPYDAPAVLNLLSHAQSEYGLWYVEGGLFKLALALKRLADEVGVRLHLGTEVVGLVSDGDRVTAAELSDGSRVRGELFVCNMEVIPAYERLLHEPPRFLRKLSKFEPACSGLVLHLGVDREYPQLGHHSFFFSGNPRKHFQDVFHRKVMPEDPTLYVVAPARTDPTQAPPGCENIKVLPHIPHLQDRRFTRDEYMQLRERALDKLERMGLEDLRRHIIVEDMWTPEDIESRYYSNRGAIYGVVSDRKLNKGFKVPKKSSKYANLYFVGGSVNPGGGMPMAVLSGQQVRDRIVARSPAG